MKAPLTRACRGLRRLGRRAEADTEAADAQRVVRSCPAPGGLALPGPWARLGVIVDARPSATPDSIHAGPCDQTDEVLLAKARRCTIRPGTVTTGACGQVCAQPVPVLGRQCSQMERTALANRNQRASSRQRHSG